jgi:uncharacterized protein
MSPYPDGMSDVALPSLRGLVEANRSGILEAVTRHKGRRVALFGSVARGDEHPGSDVDFLVEFEPGSSLFDLVRLQGELSAVLDRRVDVVSLGGLLPGDDDIRNEVIWL